MLSGLFSPLLQPHSSCRIRGRLANSSGQPGRTDPLESSIRIRRPCPEWGTDRPRISRRRKMAGLVQLLRTRNLRGEQVAHPRQTIQASNFQILNRRRLLQSEPNHAGKGSEIGGSAPKPLGFTAFAPRYLPLTSFRKGADSAAPGPSRPPSRRSGRIPALPYPPPGSHSISDETSSGMTNILNAAHSVTNHAGQFCHHSSRRHTHSCERVFRRRITARGQQSPHISSKSPPSARSATPAPYAHCPSQ